MTPRELISDAELAALSGSGPLVPGVPPLPPPQSLHRPVFGERPGTLDDSFDGAFPTQSNQFEQLDDLEELPAVVAVVVASNPGGHFEEVLSSIAHQDYSNLSVLVVDSGSDRSIADRVAAVIPDAFIHRLTTDPGWSSAANQSMQLVSGASFLLFCHDDVALDPDCVSSLLEEMYRHNAGIGGPKMVKWDDGRRLLQIGMGSDRFGVQVNLIERNEFDQEQYDVVRDVFLVPGGVQLIRADLFEALRGFDPEIPILGEDLDFCWRARVAGARIVAVPSARVRHIEQMKNRMSDGRRRQLISRHRLRTVLTTASRGSLLISVPLALLLLLIEAFYSLAAGRQSYVRDAFGAIAWNLDGLRNIRSRRARLKKLRQVSDREVRSFQVGGSARIAGFRRNLFGSSDRIAGFLGTVREMFTSSNAASARDATVIGGLLALAMFVGSRHLATRGVAPVGEMLAVPGASDLISEWLSGWRSAGIGGPGTAPSAFVLLAIGRIFFFWGSGVFDTFLVLGPLVLGIIGVWRMLRPFASPRASAIAAVAYAANPLPVAALAGGRWSALVIWGAMPFLFGSLLRVGAVSPFGDDGGTRSDSVADRVLPVRILRSTLLVAFVSSFAPSVIVVVLVLILGLCVSSGLLGRVAAARRTLLAVPAVIIVPVALHVPWSFGILRNFSWSWLIGPESPEQVYDSLADLIRFAPAGSGPSWLTVGLLAAAAIVLVHGKSVRFETAVHGWVVAVTCWLFGWFALRGWLPFGLPTMEAFLAPAAVGLALAVGLGIRSIETDLGSSKFGLKRVSIALGVIGFFGLVLGGLGSTINGRWNSPTQEYTAFTELLAADVEGSTRVLWIGSPKVLPVDAIQTQAGVSYAITEDGRADVRNRWTSGPVGETELVGTRLDLAATDETVRLGQLLSPYGIDFVVRVPQLAPSPYDGPEVPVGAGMEAALDRQLDLQLVPGLLDLVVYRNIRSGGPAVDLAGAQLPGPSLADQLDFELEGGRLNFNVVGPGRWRTSIDTGNAALIATSNTNLRVSGARDELKDGFGQLTVVEPGEPGAIEVYYPTPLRHRLALFGQFLLVAFAILLSQAKREAEQ